MQPEESEWQTRKARIDQRLRALSPAWQMVRYHPGLDLSRLTCHVVEEIPTDSGPADYGFFVSGLFLGILEAKRVGKARARKAFADLPHLVLELNEAVTA